jgi:hypothetical protein
MRASDVLRVALVAGAVVAAAASATVAVHHPITGCITDDARHSAVLSGHWFDDGRVNQLAPGDSTVEDAECAMGDPTSLVRIGAGLLVTWSYMTKSADGRVHSLSVSVSFDSAGRMLRIEQRTDA